MRQAITIKIIAKATNACLVSKLSYEMLNFLSKINQPHSMKLKTLAIMAIIIVSLFPVYLLYGYLRRALEPERSPRRFLLWLMAVFTLIFVYTFLVVLIIRLVFPGA